MLHARAGAGVEEPAGERDADRLRPELPRSEGPVVPVEHGREVDVDARAPQPDPGLPPGGARGGRRTEARGGEPGRQRRERLDRPALLVGEDERVGRPRHRAAPALHEHAADALRRGEPRDHDERGLLLRRQPGDGSEAADRDGDRREHVSQRSHPPTVSTPGGVARLGGCGDLLSAAQQQPRMRARAAARKLRRIPAGATEGATTMKRLTPLILGAILAAVLAAGALGSASAPRSLSRSRSAIRSHHCHAWAVRQRRRTRPR